jgi:UDP-N-acetylmuramoylalanine--D-glutamate ligase
VPSRSLVVGFGLTGRAVTRALRQRGAEVIVVDDHPSPAALAAAQSASVDLLEAPSRARLDSLVDTVEAVLPSPGVPDRHPVFESARRAEIPVLSEFDLAAAWDDRPLLAVTGTDGKTTVTTMVTDMLEASGTRALAAGNTDLPLVDAIDQPDIEVFVIEASSFRLGHTHEFRPAVATWLNFAEDHLDTHESFDRYERAKARIWADLDPGDGVAVANADDPVVMRHVRPQLRTVTFGLEHQVGYRVEDGELRTDSGDLLVAVDELPRSFPHDLANALAAAATALEGGASIEGVRHTLRTFAGLPHRLTRVGEWDGVMWYDDSKATTPQATLAAVRSFPQVVLIAGGRNKGTDLSVLASVHDRVRATVAIGEAAAEVADALGRGPVVMAGSMVEAVSAAADMARPGDVVLLSPACASFDWYSSYGERGDAFVAAVSEHYGEAGS